MEELLALFINIIFECGEIPEILKIGLLSPVYKKKGTKQQASNYRDITVLSGLVGNQCFCPLPLYNTPPQ
jgi:hypothetical protein